MSTETDLTLRQALGEFLAENRAVFSGRPPSPAAGTFFRYHDTAHVVFGCDTSVYGEGLVKLWTIFGTTLGFFGHLKGYGEANAFSLFRQYGWRHVNTQLARLMRDMFSVIRHARAMKEPWPWDDYEQYLDWTLSDIRHTFGIEVVSVNSSGSAKSEETVP